MIKVNYQIIDKQMKKITISGHANYADLGKDIVCASVSAMLTTTVNGILSINNQAIKYADGDYFTIDNLSFDEITNKLLDNLISLFKELSVDYPKNIVVREEVK